MAFNRDRNSRGGDRGGFSPRFAGGAGRSRPSFDRPRFNDRGGDHGPVEMHDAICDNCGKGCQVPFRPTQGKPVYCSACFENRAGSMESRDSRRFEDRRPERSESKPSFDQPNYSAQFEALSSKLDKIISLLEQSEKPASAKKKAKASKKVEEQTEALDPSPVTEE